ncbi:alpha/beta hydrolase [Chelativorans sp. M5D2P16]|uniref:alpha/beta hydrolase n=1 Tax=Chelativorans sp. M5D2P16 TaxID=3095678 RepID=UPI002AC9F526|nr:alpha/beta hydrolase [Chelativorans sp. M5D2P16]MDZ5698720.1 alpha/beta hydrolase [Chelativorans sp. M5D2P16]
MNGRSGNDQELSMPRQILFIQGAGERVHDAWDDKLVLSLETQLGEQYAVRYPRMPNEAEPLYPAWKATLFREFEELADDAILVGHSIGATFLIHAVAEHQPKRKWGAVLLIAAPFLGDDGWPGDETDPVTDLTEELRADVPVFLYHGTADEEVPLKHIELYAQAVPHATAHVLADQDHQLNNDLSEIARDIRNDFRLR